MTLQANVDIMSLALDLARYDDSPTDHIYDTPTGERPLGEVVSVAEKLYHAGWRKSTIVWTQENLLLEVKKELPAMGIRPTETTAEVPGYAIPRAQHVPASNRQPKGTPAAVAWGSKWVDPSNLEIPAKGQERVKAGWIINTRMKAVIALFTGQGGRVTATLETIDKRAGLKGTGRGKGQYYKPSITVYQLIRRGLMLEVKHGVYCLSPRGRLFVVEHLKLEPTTDPVAVEVVAS